MDHVKCILAYAPAAEQLPAVGLLPDIMMINSRKGLTDGGRKQEETDTKGSGGTAADHCRIGHTLSFRAS